MRSNIVKIILLLLALGFCACENADRTNDHAPERDSAKKTFYGQTLSGAKGLSNSLEDRDGEVEHQSEKLFDE